MATLMYTALAVAYGLSLWSLQRQLRHSPPTGGESIQRRMSVSSDRPMQRSVQRRGPRAAAV